MAVLGGNSVNGTPTASFATVEGNGTNYIRGNKEITNLEPVNVVYNETAQVSAADRSKIIPENIVDGVTILGVTGTAGGGGSSYYDFLDKKILSEDIISFNESFSCEIPNFNTFMNDTFASDPNQDYIEWWRHFMEDFEPVPFMLPKDYRFTLVYSDGSSSTFSFGDGKDVGQYPITPITDPAISTEWNYNYSNVAHIEATSENSGDITFELSNGSNFLISVSIETDAETGDARLYFFFSDYDQGTSSIPASNVTKLVVWMPSCNTHYVEKHVVNDFDGLHDCLDYIASNMDFDGDPVTYSGDPIDKTFVFDDVQFIDLDEGFAQYLDTEFYKNIYSCGHMFLDFSGYIEKAFHENDNVTVLPLSGMISGVETDAETGDSRVVLAPIFVNEEAYPYPAYDAIKSIFNGTIRIKIEPTN